MSKRRKQQGKRQHGDSESHVARIWAAPIALALLLSLAAAASAPASFGTWERTWGKDVVNPGAGTGFEICTAAADCQPGVAGVAGGELDFPARIATDAAGNVYVVDQENQRIQKFNPSGAWERTWGKDVNGTVAGDGFEVCTAASGHTCKEGLIGDAGGEMHYPEGVGTDGAGNVYVADQSNHRIQKFTSSGTWQRAWGKDVNTGDGSSEICVVAESCQAGWPLGPTGGTMNNPIDVAGDEAGNVYVAERHNHRIQKFSSSGAWESAWGKDVDAVTEWAFFEICTVAAQCKAGDNTGGRGGEMDEPQGVVTDRAGGVYVADTHGHRIQKFTSSGAWQRAWGKDVNATVMGIGFEICTAASGDTCKQGVGDGGRGGEMTIPEGIGTDGAGNVYVADRLGHRVQKFNSVGTWARAWGKDVIEGNGFTGFEVCTVAASCKKGVGTGAEVGQVSSPEGVGADAAGNVYVTEPSDRIQKFAGPPPPAPARPAVMVPRNDFSFGKLKKKTNKGIAFLFVEVPGPGEIGLAGKGIAGIGLSGAAAQASRAVSGGRVKLKIKPANKGKKAKRLRLRLNDKGKAKVKVRVSYVPAGGAPNTLVRKLKLIRK